ncbi:hypothetical protein ACHAO7_011590 [Fusarium culmorum]
MSAAVFENSEFQEVLANTLVKMAKQTVAEVQQKTRKAKQEHAEDRDTADPRIVTELLTSIIRGVGKSITVEGMDRGFKKSTLLFRLLRSVYTNAGQTSATVCRNPWT